MGEAPLISICIPAYQRTDYLKRLLDSIDIQRFRNFEVIITDDSPSDQVKNLAEAHALSPKIRYYKNQQVLGSPENWNEGLRKARGEWIKPIHDDDWFSGPDCLYSFIQSTNDEKVSFIYSAYRNVYPDGKTQMMRHAAFNPIINRNPETLLAANRIGPPSCVLFRKDNAVFFDSRMKWLVDIDFYIRYLKKYHRAKYLRAPLVQIGISSTQVTQASFGKPEIEIPERFLLQEKLSPDSLKNIRIYDSWWRFFRNMHIHSPAVIADSGYHGPIPEVLDKMIQLQKNFSPQVLHTGLLSKMLMGYFFLTQKK